MLPLAFRAVEVGAFTAPAAGLPTRTRAKSLGELDRDPLERFHRRAAEVGGRLRPWGGGAAGARAVGRRRFDRHHVDRRPGKLPGVEGREQTSSIDHAATRAVHQVRVLAFRSESSRRSDQPPRLIVERDVQRDEVGLAEQQFVERHQLSRRTLSARVCVKCTDRGASSFMPNARARCATAPPMRPSPTIPSVLPQSSVTDQRACGIPSSRPHARRRRPACGASSESISAKVCSVAASVFAPGGVEDDDPGFALRRRRRSRRPRRRRGRPRRGGLRAASNRAIDAGLGTDDQAVGTGEARIRAPRDSPTSETTSIPASRKTPKAALGERLGDDDSAGGKHEAE